MANITTTSTAIRFSRGSVSKSFLANVDEIGGKKPGIRVYGHQVSVYVYLTDTVNGQSFSTTKALREYADANFFRSGGTGPGSGVQSVTGDGVGGTADNPVLSFPTPAQIGAATADQGAKADTALQPSDTSMLPVAGKVPVFSAQGLLSTGTPEFPENAVPLYYLDATVEMIRGITVTVTGNKTFSMNDSWSYQRNTAVCVLTVPTNTSVAFPINTLIQGFTAGQVASFVAASGVTINSDEGKLALRPNTGWSIKKVGTNEWDLIGSFS